MTKIWLDVEDGSQALPFFDRRGVAVIGISSRAYSMFHDFLKNEKVEKTILNTVLSCPITPITDDDIGYVMVVNPQTYGLFIEMIQHVESYGGGSLSIHDICQFTFAPVDVCMPVVAKNIDSVKDKLFRVGSDLYKIYYLRRDSDIPSICYEAIGKHGDDAPVFVSKLSSTAVINNLSSYLCMFANPSTDEELINAFLGDVAAEVVG